MNSEAKNTNPLYYTLERKNTFYFTKDGGKAVAKQGALLQLLREPVKITPMLYLDLKAYMKTLNKNLIEL